MYPLTNQIHCLDVSCFLYHKTNNSIIMVANNLIISRDECRTGVTLNDGEIKSRWRKKFAAMLLSVGLWRVYFQNVYRVVIYSSSRSNTTQLF